MKNNTNMQAFCKRNKIGTLDFYLRSVNCVTYLFTTKYYSYNIFKEYQNGIRIEEIFHNTKMFRQQKLKERILRMVKYVSYEKSVYQFKEKTNKEAREIEYNYEAA